MLYDPKWAPPETEIELKPWQALLLKAADLLEQRGWVQGAFREAGRFCTLGAVRQASGYYRSQASVDTVNEWQTTETIYREVIANLDLSFPNGVVAWNDGPNQTKEGVISKLREIAKSC